MDVIEKVTTYFLPNHANSLLLQISVSCPPPHNNRGECDVACGTCCLEKVHVQQLYVFPATMLLYSGSSVDLVLIRLLSTTTIQ